MIPNKIHYCWFGGSELDEKSKRCIESWQKFFPEYEIIRWDETNFDINQVGFMKDAYEQKKWAFVSDVARLIIMYQNGGIYFDTDVEVVKSFEDILEESPKGFFGFEVTGYVASGLGFAAEEGDPFLLKVIEKYRGINFLDSINTLDKIACPIIMTDLMEKEGYLRENKFQFFRYFHIYPTYYFSPLDYETGKIKMTSDTHSIHWGNASWCDSSQRAKSSMQRYNRIFGKKLGEKIYGVHSCMKKEGILNYVKRHL